VAEGAPALTPPVERRLYLLRHAETEALDARGHMRSADPIPLTERGVVQAQALGQLFADVPVTAVHASPLDRTAHTARLVAGPERAVHFHPGLEEISLGDYDGAHSSEIFAAAPGWLADPDAALPGGESLNEVADRAVATLDAILAESSERELVLVAHGGVNRGLIARLIGLRMDLAHRIRQDWASVNVLDLAEGRWWPGVLNLTPFGVEEIPIARGAFIDARAMGRIGR
jgi:broad specificity phosphatase PhoE